MLHTVEKSMKIFGQKFFRSFEAYVFYEPALPKRHAGRSDITMLHSPCLSSLTCWRGISGGFTLVSLHNGSDKASLSKPLSRHRCPRRSY